MVVFFLVFVSGKHMAAAQEQGDIPEGVIQKWKNYWTNAAHSSTRAEIFSTSQKGDKNIVTRSIIDFPCLIVETENKTAQTNHVLGFNLQYHFVLSKRTEETDWKIERVETRDNVPTNPWDWLTGAKPASDPVAAALRDSCLPFLVCGAVTLPEMVHSDEVQVAIHGLNEGSEQSPATLEYKTTDKDTANQFRGVFQYGTATLDPKSFLVTRAETLVEEQPEYKILLQNEYEEGENDVPVLTKSVETVVVSGNEVYSSVRTVQTDSVTDIGPERFSLSHYGLEEPASLARTERYHHIRLWLLAGSVLLFLLVRRIMSRTT
ncbi:MAG: hypothetical protein Q4G68_07030 [Planctomycetia bacterium]|nr:hypothetical protein [Planctomycetia bacterium]